MSGKPRIREAPDKREQNDARIGSAEREEQVTKAQPKGNVPALRFPEFTGEWKRCTLEDCADFLDGLRKPIKSEDRKCEKGLYPYYGASGIIDYIDEYIFDGEYVLLSEDGANILDRNYRVAYIARGKIWVNNHAHVLLPYKNIDINFLSEALERLNYAIYNTGTTMPKLNQEVCRKICLNVPSREEQNKIGNLLFLLNERIATQNKIIEKLGTLIKGIRNNVLNNKLQNSTRKKLGELCTITTGKLDANAMKLEGQYPFFTCAEEVYRIDSFAFDTEALLVSGNGANLGYIHYYKGKFNAYQRTYVLSNFIEDIHYIQIYLEAYLHKRIALEKSTSNTPYIVLATLAEMPIIIPNIKIQKDISNKILILKSKLITEIHIRNCYKDMRQFLLSQMFI